MTPPATPGQRGSRGSTKHLLQVKGASPELKRRFKVAAAEEGVTYAQLIERWLDARDRAAERARARQAHPLHRPTNHTQMEAAAP